MLGQMTLGAGARCPALPAVYSDLGGDEELAELVEMFVEEMPERMARIAAELAQADWPALIRTAHQLKGAAGSYGFHQITPLARSLERALCNQSPENQIRAAAQELLRMCERLRGGVAG